MRKWSPRERIYTTLQSFEEVEYLAEHLDNWIETLRLFIMCGGDVSMYTFHKHKPHQVKPTTKTNSRRQCISWVSLKSGAGNMYMVETNPRLNSPKQEPELQIIVGVAMGDSILAHNQNKNGFIKSLSNE